MTAIVIGLLSVSVGAAFSVSFGSVIVGDVLMGFGLFTGIKGLLCVLIETLRAESEPEPTFAFSPAPPRPAMRPERRLPPRPPHAVALRRLAEAA